MAKKSFAAFEKADKAADKKKGIKESPQEEMMDRMKMRGMAKGGKVKSCATGGIMRGTGAATKGKKFSYNG